MSYLTGKLPSVTLGWLGTVLIASSVAQAGEPDSQPPTDPFPARGTSLGQVNSVQQFRDVSPFDWSYEALQNMVENYGCIVGYPDRTFRGNRALTRNEFVAGLSACLEQLERRKLEAETTPAVGNVSATRAFPGEPIPKVFNRAFYHNTGRFYEINNISGQANAIFGWRTFPGSFFDNQITEDALTVETVYWDVLRQQQAGPPLVTRDLPNPFNSSVIENPAYLRLEGAPVRQPAVIIERVQPQPLPFP